MISTTKTTGICHEAPHSWSLLQLQSLSWTTSAGRWKIDEFTGREVMDLPPETPLKNFSYILAAGIFDIKDDETLAMLKGGSNNVL